MVGSGGEMREDKWAALAVFIPFLAFFSSK